MSFVVFDLETTGLDTLRCDIVQFAYAMFDYDNRFVKAETLYFYKEGMHWSEEAYAVHGFSQDFLSQYKDVFEENCIKMYTVLNRANVIGHNCISFDCPFAKNWLARQGLVDFEFAVKQDTMTAFRSITKRPRISLIRLCEMFDYKPETINYVASMWFGGSEKSSHDASYDVTATALLALKGLNEKFITFEPTVIIAQDVSSHSDLDMVYSEEQKTFDPNGIVICYTDDESVKWYRLNSDRDKYHEVTIEEGFLGVYRERDELCDKVMRKTADGYIIDTDGMEVKVVSDRHGDSVCIKSKYLPNWTAIPFDQAKKLLRS